MSELYIVYCIDTEGPLYESLEATFERIRSTFEVEIEPTSENLALLQEGNCPEGYNISNRVLIEIKSFISPKLLEYKKDWHDLDNMWESCFSKGFRNDELLLDDVGNGIIYNFFIMDHVGFSSNNPRRRSYGYHVVFDYYKSLIKRYKSEDKIYWHFHPIHFTKDAHKAASSYTYSWDTIHETIARKIIDRDFFPCVNRPGFHTERPDIHLFLEMWIPFDYANQSLIKRQDNNQKDVGEGRFGDWRRAPFDWSIYQPNHDDYQTIGSCRRSIAKCLNVGTRLRTVNDGEIRAAFLKANIDGKAILSFANHDWRDIRKDIISVYEIVKRIQNEFPEVRIINSPAGNAMRKMLFDSSVNNFMWDIQHRNNNDILKIEITVSKGECFGPQPFLAIKTLEGKYYHDNFDVHVPHKSFSYVFDDFTLNPKVIDCIGIGTCDKYGVFHIIKATFKAGIVDDIKKVDGTKMFI